MARPIIESSAKRYSRVIKSPAVIAGTVGGPSYLRGSGLGAWAGDQRERTATKASAVLMRVRLIWDCAMQRKCRFGAGSE